MLRTLVAAFLAWFLPARGKRRATPAPVVRRVPRPLPAPRAPRPTDVIEADGLPLVRPYVVAGERQREQERQRDRHTAAALATFGIDYPYGPQGRAA